MRGQSACNENRNVGLGFRVWGFGGQVECSMRAESFGIRLDLSEFLVSIEVRTTSGIPLRQDYKDCRNPVQRNKRRQLQQS